ncbi:aldo/keto reductase [Brenneria populi subsp. brevivirga]|uniref:aldo/keto reductase n=1 Tax=Brenneria populi TaxID=1505588 RepID=UPI002E188526|nr:aldo/keto reductase [Brenneria populi subsp. brevivirga]
MLMKKRKLGRSEVGIIGLGCMGMSHAYGESDVNDNIRVFEKALELGCNHWDTADFYGFGGNEKLISRILKNNRDNVYIATKTGLEFDENISLLEMKKKGTIGVNNSKKYIKKHLDDSLSRLGTESVDLYYLHRMDKNIPIEETMEVMLELLNSGKIKGIGLCEVDADIIRRAQRVCPLTAVQMEYSIWSREIEREILPTCNELDISIVSYAPLGRGFLTGKITNMDAIGQSDMRHHFPRFKNLSKNILICKTIEEIAEKHNVTSAQIALAWILAKNHSIFLIPGTKSIKHLTENISALSIVLSETEINTLDNIQVYGERYPKIMMDNVIR